MKKMIKPDRKMSKGWLLQFPEKEMQTALRHKKRSSILLIMRKQQWAIIGRGAHIHLPGSLGTTGCKPRLQR